MRTPGILPFNSTKAAYEAFIEWGKYLQELFDQKLLETRTGETGEGMDLMGALVKSSYSDTNKTTSSPDSPLTSPSRSSSTERKSSAESPHVLSDSEILGNAFIFILAGHETTANSIHFALLDLACSPSSQRRLQASIDDIFGAQSPSEWVYEDCINALFGGMVGAVLNEVLRLMPPVIIIPKCVTKDAEQVIVLDGRKVELPRGATINLNAVGVQRNPKYWPSAGRSKVDGTEDDMNDFVPERWLTGTSGRSSGSPAVTASDNLRKDSDKFDRASKSDGGAHQTSANHHTQMGTDSTEEEDYGGPVGHDTSNQLFHPPRGAYIPFSEGARSCLGRRFAQVEVLVALAVIFQKWSVELAIDDFLPLKGDGGKEEREAEVERLTEQMGVEERKEVYVKAVSRARERVRCAESLFTLQLKGESVKVRLVKRGREKFLGAMD